MALTCASRRLRALCAVAVLALEGEATDVTDVVHFVAPGTSDDASCVGVQDSEDVAAEVQLLQTDIKMNPSAPPLQPATPPVTAEANDLSTQVSSQAITPLLLPTAMPWGGTKSDIRYLIRASKTTACGLLAFTHGTVVNFFLCALCLIAFGYLRLRYPRVYAANVLKGLAPMVPPTAFFGWIRASLRVNTEGAVLAAGLDAGMLLEFCNLCMKILLTMGLPQVMILCPMHFFCGKGEIQGDLLSTVNMGNVKDKHPWFHWIQAIAMWFAFLATDARVFGAAEALLRHRLAWLKERPAPVAATVIIDGSPMTGCAESAWKAFFYQALSHKWRPEAATVRSIEELAKLVRQGGGGSSSLGNFTMIRGVFLGRDIGCVTCQQKQLNEIEQLTAFEWAWAHKEEQADLTQATPLGIAAYYRSKEDEIAQGLRFDPDGEETVIYVSTGLAKRIWEEEPQPSRAGDKLSAASWYCAAVLIFLLAVPACGAVTNLGLLVKLGPRLQPAWTAFAPAATLLLILRMATPLLAFSRGQFLEMKAEGRSQHTMYVWSFWFHFIMLIPVVVIGRLAFIFFADLATENWSILKILSVDMPQSTDFYLNFMVLLWFYHGLSLICCVPLRTLASRWFGGPSAAEEAPALCGPVASRSAQWTAHMVVCLVFCTASPLVCLLGFANFALCRLVYGYLIVFAEARRRDLGGALFMNQLRHLLFGIVVYILLMVVVMAFRSPSWGPVLAALPILGHACWSFVRFRAIYDLEKMPFTEVDLPSDLPEAPPSPAAESVAASAAERAARV